MWQFEITQKLYITGCGILPQRGRHRIIVKTIRIRQKQIDIRPRLVETGNYSKTLTFVYRAAKAITVKCYQRSVNSTYEYER